MFKWKDSQLDGDDLLNHMESRINELQKQLEAADKLYLEQEQLILSLKDKLSNIPLNTSKTAYKPLSRYTYTYIARRLNISRMTLYRYMKNNPINITNEYELIEFINKYNELKK